MMELLDLDRVLFELINGQWRLPFLDTLMPYWRSKYFWIPIYVFGLFFLLLNFKKRGFYYILFLVLCVAFTDVCSSQWIKKSVQRPRPCQIMNHSEINLLVRCGSGYSFPSSHASNHFAIATFAAFTLGRYFRFFSMIAFFWAFSIAYGQVYVGVHYPFDILAGAILGMMIGSLISFFYWRLEEWQLFVLK